MPDNLTLAGLACLAYTAVFSWFGIGTARVSQRRDEGFFRWPVASRIIVALACFGFVALFLNSARIILRPAWLEPVWPVNPAGWGFAASVLAPLPFCVWVARRLATGGLLDDDGTTRVNRLRIPLTARYASVSGFDDNLRRSVRCLSQGLIGGLVHQTLEANGVYDVRGWGEPVAVAVYMGVSNLVWNTLEDRWGVRFLPPRDHVLGDAAIEEGRS